MDEQKEKNPKYTTTFRCHAGCCGNRVFYSPTQRKIQLIKMSSACSFGCVLHCSNAQTYDPTYCIELDMVEKASIITLANERGSNSDRFVSILQSTKAKYERHLLKARRHAKEAQIYLAKLTLINVIRKKIFNPL